MKKRSYWHDNLRVVGLCLAIWFFVSFGLGILFVDVLNQIQVGGFKLQDTKPLAAVVAWLEARIEVFTPEETVHYWLSYELRLFKADFGVTES